MNPEGGEGLAEDRSLTSVPLRLSNERGILNDRRIYSLFIFFIFLFFLFFIVCS